MSLQQTSQHLYNTLHLLMHTQSHTLWLASYLYQLNFLLISCCLQFIVGKRSARGVHSWVRAKRLCLNVVSMCACSVLYMCNYKRTARSGCNRLSVSRSLECVLWIALLWPGLYRSCVEVSVFLRVVGVCRSGVCDFRVYCMPVHVYMYHATITKPEDVTNHAIAAINYIPLHPLHTKNRI